MTIAVNDRVTFTERRTYRPYLHTVTGTVVDLLPWTPCALALVELDSGLMPKLVSVDRLSVVDEQDDVQETLSVHPAPYELMAELDDTYCVGMAGAMGTGVVEG